MQINEELLKLSFAQIKGVVIIDNDMKIQYISSDWAEKLKRKQEDLIGLNIRDVVPNTKMDMIVDTGEELLMELFLQGEEYSFCNRIPLYNDGKLAGAMSYHVGYRDDMLKKLHTQLNLLTKELRSIKKAANTSKYTIKDIIGNSDLTKKLREQIYAAAMVNSTVFITGETGTGKELVAHTINSLSPRQYNSFIRINCSAIPDDLIEAELFGYEGGSFTGAVAGGREGKFELANKGTIFLDEIADLPLTMQAKLLRVLQEKEFTRIGGKNNILIDVRVIAACNTDIEQLIEEKKFRKDLYYRLNVLNIEVPSLRDRVEDIPLLVDHFIKKNNHDMQMSIKSCSPKLIKMFQNYSWPGNIRQLQNVIERAMIGARKSNVLSEEHVEWPDTFSINEKKYSHKKLNTAISETERNVIIGVLDNTSWNKTKAAESLGIPRPVLYKKMKRLDIPLNKE